MKNKKCGNCGASVDVDSAGKCKYCGSTFSKEEDNRPIVINNYYTVEKNVVHPLDYSKKDRENPYVEEESYKENHAPEINLFLCIMLFLIAPIAGVIYLLYKITKSKKHHDDE